ncbi:uncharacterized protein RAG0_03938 [Rhynchosporium agropyri]|uniref:Uncharacterized protein n=1 Tax=Rhynchosporium agropyri TaxID=914238 RepID=A0A1E1K758_9HELO|nr:uncharacterized protein RAG0_03938 [Rhynchosporium agropyri]
MASHAQQKSYAHGAHPSQASPMPGSTSSRRNELPSQQDSRAPEAHNLQPIHPQVASQPAPYQQAPYQPNYFHKYATMPQAPAIMSTSTLPHLMPSQLLARPKVRLVGEAFRQFLKAKYEKRVAKRAANAAVVKWKLVVTGFQAKKLVVLDQHQDPQTRTLIEKSKKPVFFEQHNNQQAQTHSVEQSREPSNPPSHPAGESDDCRVNQPKHGPDAHADAMRCVDKLLGLVHGHDGRILDKLNIEEWEILASDMIYETSGSQSCIMMPSWTSSHRSEKPSPHFRQHSIFFLPMNLNRTMVATIVDIPQQRLYIFGPSRLHQDLINRSEFILRVNDIPCGGSTWKHRGLEYQDDTTDSECAIWTMFFLKRHLTGETLDPHDYGVTDLRYRYARVFAYEYEALRLEISELLDAYRSVHRMGSSMSLNPSPSGAQRSNTTSFVSGTVASSLSTPGTPKDKREVSLGLGHLYATSPKGEDTWSTLFSNIEVPDLSFNKPVSQPFIQNENPTRKDVNPTHHDPALRGSDGDDTLYPRSSMITTRNTDNAQPGKQRLQNRSAGKMADTDPADVLSFETCKTQGNEEIEWQESTWTLNGQWSEEEGWSM